MDPRTIRYPSMGTPRVAAPALGFALAMCLLTAPPARAQFAVIDVGAITQLITEVQILEDQLTTARAHLAQAQLEFASLHREIVPIHLPHLRHDDLPTTACQGRSQEKAFPGELPHV